MSGAGGFGGSGGFAGSGGFPDQDAATDGAASFVDASPEGPLVCPAMAIPGDCSPPPDVRCPYPKLSQTGCVDPTNPLQLAASVIPYEVNSPLWSDGALKTRGMRIPAGKKIHVKDCVKNPTQCQVGNPNNFPNFLPPYDDGKWVFPVGTVMVQNFMFTDYSTLSGVKLVETRLLVHFDEATWVGYGYQWNDAQTEATIVPDAASNPTFVPAGADVAVQATFTTRYGLITWNYPDRAACMKCHVSTVNNVPFPPVVTGGSVLGPETSQMNRVVLAANGVDQINQIDKLNALNLFDVPPPMPYKTALVAPYAGQAGTPPADATLEQRARSYLHANCSFCHRPDALIFYAMDLRYDVPLKSTGTCNVLPDKGDQGVLGASRLTPGDPARSVLWLRVNTQTAVNGRMPQLGSYVIDTDAVLLLSDWIRSIRPSDCGP
ncbi:MAG TPA: hypothetical protein VMU50_18045 [Polyangia bacterium]|nr:hypothetical protein [Polyangia bacterium]